MSDCKLLAERAAHFHKLVMDMAYGPGGMIVDFARFETRRPFQDGVIYGGKYHKEWVERSYGDIWGDLSPKPSPVDIWYGENTLWATGLFLESQLVRYRATHDEEARLTAQKCFLDLNHYFRMSATIEPGVLGKPHGGRAGGTWSYDQSAIPIIPYARYALELADAEEKAIAAANLAAHGDMYIRRNWVINFYGRNYSIVGSGHQSALKLIGSVYACYEVTGNTRYRDFALDALKPMIAKNQLPWSAENPNYPPNHNMWYWAYICDAWSRSDIRDEFDWKYCIGEYWHTVKKSLGKDNPVFSTSEHNVALALLANSHGLDDEVPQIAGQLLLAIDEDKLRWAYDENLPSELQSLNNVFATERPALWLAAYWTGKLQGIW